MLAAQVGEPQCGLGAPLGRVGGRDPEGFRARPPDISNKEIKEAQCPG